jgi:hypothetical protein
MSAAAVRYCKEYWGRFPVFFEIWSKHAGTSGRKAQCAFLLLNTRIHNYWI